MNGDKSIAYDAQYQAHLFRRLQNRMAATHNQSTADAAPNEPCRRAGTISTSGSNRTLAVLMSNDRKEPNPVIAFFRCVRSQHENRLESIIFSAAMQRE